MEPPYPVGQEFVFQRMTSAGKLSLGSATPTGGSFVVSLTNLWDATMALSEGGFIPKGTEEAVFCHEFGEVIREEMLHCILLRYGVELRFHHRLHALIDEYSEVAPEARLKPVPKAAQRWGDPHTLVLSEHRHVAGGR